MGGLGNQMFQYAAAKSLALKHRTPLFLDLSHLLDKTPRANFTPREFGLEIFNGSYAIADQQVLEKFFPKNILTKIKRKLGKETFHYYYEPCFHFDPDFNVLTSNCYLEGYFQSEKYFSDYKKIIQQDFTLSMPLTGKIRTLLLNLSNEQSVCLHIRRGDLNFNSFLQAEHGLLSLEYYYNGIKEIKKKHAHIHIYVFSDDIEWCFTNLKFDDPVTFVEREYAGETNATYLQLMQTCSHFVISNSTFGWWAAWLGNKEEKMVVAPLQWFKTSTKNTKDILPDSWIKL